MLSRLINFEFTESNPPEKEGYEYGYALFEHMPDIHFNSGKQKPCTTHKYY